MAEAVIVEAVRSPVGKRNGGLSGVHPGELSAQVLNGLVERAGIDPEIVDDVIWGCVMQAGEQALDIARTAVLAAGWPESVPGVTVDRQCGSSQQSIHFAAAGVVAGHYDVVVAGGVESMSRTPMGASLANGGHPYPEAFRNRYSQTPNQGIGAEMIASQEGVGHMIHWGQTTFRPDLVIGGMLLIGAVGFGLNRLFAAAERRLLVGRVP